MGILTRLFPPSTTAEEAYEALRRRQVVIVDVREPREWRAGHAHGSKNIPLAKLSTRAKELAPGRRYVAVCRSGSRSRRATRKLRKAGLDVVNMKGGMSAWQRAGLPLEPRNAKIV